MHIKIKDKVKVSYPKLKGDLEIKMKGFSQVTLELTKHKCKQPLKVLISAHLS